MCMWSIIIYISYILRKSSPHNSDGIKVVSLFSYRGKSYFEDKKDNKLIAIVVVFFFFQINRELFINDFFQNYIKPGWVQFLRNNSNNHIYRRRPLALAVFTGALQMCVYRSVYRNKQVSSVSVSLRFVGRFPKRTSSYKNLFYKLNVMLFSLKAYKSVLFFFLQRIMSIEF